MRLPIFQVDAFTDRLFAGNPAAVVILERWLPDPVLQLVASENNVSETAFVLPGNDEFELRWFSPRIEVELCGHATLAAAHVLFQHGYEAGSELVFRYQGGQLRAETDGRRLRMDFPALPAKRISNDPRVERGLGAKPTELHRSTNLLAVFEKQTQLEGLRPDFAVLGSLDTFGVIVTSPGRNYDFVSRFFAPDAGVPEDPVTGSAHCTLTPYWSRRLGRRHLRARQISPRGGELVCEDLGERVLLSGEVREYLRGEIELDQE